MKGTSACLATWTIGEIATATTPTMIEEAETAVVAAVVVAAGVEARTMVDIDRTEAEEAARKKGTLAQGINQARTEVLIVKA